MDRIWEDYLDHLLDISNLYDFSDDYYVLFRELNNMDFHFLMERDDNRKWDGLKYREEWAEHNIFDPDLKDEFLNEECTVLEMLIGLSIRIEGDYIGDPLNTHPEYFIMEMLENLGLGAFTGRKINQAKVTKIIDKWLDRKFTKNGKGSPFPVKYDKRDQRELEIWDQMMAYINENYE